MYLKKLINSFYMFLRFSCYNIFDCFGYWKKCYVIEIDV